MSKKTYVVDRGSRSGGWTTRNSAMGKHSTTSVERISPKGERTTHVARDGHSGQFTVGRDNMTKLNAIEGIKQSAASREMFDDFDRQGLSPSDRRQAIVARHKKG